MFSSLEPTSAELRDRHTSSIGVAIGFDFAEKFSETTLRLALRTAKRFTRLVAFAVGAPRCFHTEIPGAGDAPRFDMTSHA
jgi:hypothetical protein